MRTRGPERKTRSASTVASLILLLRRLRKAQSSEGFATPVPVPAPQCAGSHKTYYTTRLCALFFGARPGYNINKMVRPEAY